MKKAPVLLNQIIKAENRARRLQAQLDKMQNQWVEASEVMRSDFAEEWQAYCKKNGIVPFYTFGDVLA